MNNGVYTNTMKGSRKRVDARLAMNAKDYYKLAFKLILVAQKIINKNLTALLKFFLKRIVHKFCLKHIRMSFKLK